MPWAGVRSRAMGKRKPREDRAQNVRCLLSVDAANVMARLAVREEEMVTLFSRHRDRRPMLETIHAIGPTAGFGELALLAPLEQVAVNGFYERLAELRWYLQYTEDMPVQVRLKLKELFKRLSVAHRAMVSVLKVVDTGHGPVVEARVEVMPRKRVNSAGG
jgi:hypothetical protein